MRWRQAKPGRGGDGWRVEGPFLMSPTCLPPEHFTTWLDLLDHWQSLAAGLVAVFAAI
jgi:hypothetical protein